MQAEKLRKQRAEVAKFVEELLAITSPDQQVSGHRRFARHSRSLPAVVFPWEYGRIVASQPLLSTTKDLSTGGASLLLQADFAWDEFAIALPFGAFPVFVHSRVCHRTPLSFSFWQLGVEWIELVTPDSCPDLRRLARQLQELNASINA